MATYGDTVIDVEMDDFDDLHGGDEAGVITKKWLEVKVMHAHVDPLGGPISPNWPGSVGSA